MLLQRLSLPVRGVRVVLKDDSPLGAQIIPQRRLDADDVRRLIAHLEPRATGPIVTSALGSIEQDGFREVGFIERESLYLLRHSLKAVPPHDSPARLRVGRRSDIARVLEIDSASFDDFWQLDRDGLTSARKATPVNYYRVATIDRHVVGYVVTGRAGRATFLQRLGVDPTHRGKGIGTQLVADAIAWAIGQGGTSMLVNTQTVNVPARQLYERLGFILDREQLKVLEWPR